MEKLSAKKRGAIVGDYLSGLPYREIAAKHHVSTGAVAGVVADLKEGRFPEAGDIGEHIEQLKELSLDLKRANLTPGRCALGLTVLARIKECGLEPTDIDRWPLILKSVGNEDEAQQFVQLIYSIQEVQKRTGLSLDALDDKVHGLEKKTAELEPISAKLDDSKKEVTKLTRQRKELFAEVSSLEEKRKLLNPEVKDLGRQEKDLSLRIADMEPRAKKAETTLVTFSEEMQRLQGIGFTFEQLAEFNRKLQVIAQRHAINPDELKSRLLHELETLDKGLGLEALVTAKKMELKATVQAVAGTKKELETTTAVVNSLKQEKRNLEASIKETREKVSREIARIIPAATDAINRLLAELRRGHAEALTQVKEQEQEHTRVVAALRTAEGTMRAAIQELAASGQGAIEQAQKKALTAVAEAAESMAKELKQWGDARAELSAYQEDLRRARYFTKLPLGQEALEAFVNDISPLIVGQYFQIGALWCSKRLNPKLRPPAWITRKYCSIADYTNLELADLVRWSAEAFIEGAGKNER